MATLTLLLKKSLAAQPNPRSQCVASLGRGGSCKCRIVGWGDLGVGCGEKQQGREEAFFFNTGHFLHRIQVSPIGGGYRFLISCISSKTMHPALPGGQLSCGCGLWLDRPGVAGEPLSKQRRFTRGFLGPHEHQGALPLNLVAGNR